MEAQRAPVPRPEARRRTMPRTASSCEEAKGVLFLDSLRRKMGDDAFLKLMADYFAANTTKTVTAQSFLDKAGVRFRIRRARRTARPI